MATMKLVDGTTIEIIDGAMNQAFQMKVDSLSKWDDIASSLTQKNMQTIEYNENGSIIRCFNKKLSSCSISIRKDGGYIVTAFLDDVPEEEVKLNELKSSVNNLSKMILGL